MISPRVTFLSALFAFALFLPSIASAGWYEQQSGISTDLYGVDMGSTQAAIAVGASGTVLYTTDGGAKWLAGTSGTTSDLQAVDMTTNTVGYAVGGTGLILKTSDAGVTWTQVGSGVTTEKLYDIKMYSTTTGYIVGGNGTILRTTDSGTTWTALTSGTTETLYAVDAISNTVAWVGGANGVLLRTSTGTTWSVVTTGVTSTILGVEMLSGSTVHIVGGGSLHQKTTDMGATWTSEGGAASIAAIVGEIIAYNNSNIMTLGMDASAMVTTNGSTWTSEAISTKGAQYGLAWYALNARIAVGAGGGIYGYDITAPVVGSVTPTTATEASATTFSATYSDAIAVDTCSLYVDGVAVGDMVLASGTATFSFMPPTSGTASMYVTCADSAGNIGTGATTSVTVAAAAEGSGAGSESDTTAPTVSTVTPTAGTFGVTATWSVTYSDDAGVTGCTFIFDGSDKGSMTLSSGTASIEFAPDDSGTSSAYATCVDETGNKGEGGVTLITVAATSDDAIEPVVEAVTPTTATEDVAVTFSARYSDAVGVTSCSLNAEGTDTVMTLGNGTASVGYTFTTSGTFVVYVTCADAAGNKGASAEATVTVTAATTITADATAPTVSAVTPTKATAGAAVTLSATYADAVGVTSCSILIDGTDSHSMALSSGTASASGTFDTSGSHTAAVSCVDAAGNTGTGATTTITVAAASTDTTGPTVSAVTPTTATQNTAVTMSVTASDSSGMYECKLFVDGSNQGAMTANGSTYSRSYTFATSGTSTVYVRCGDAVGNETTGTSTTVTVAAAATTTTDTTAPTVGALTPDEAIAGTALTLSASVADSGGMGSCVLYVNSTYIGAMQIANGYATYSYTFSDAGTAIGNAYCTDAAGYSTRGASTTFTVAAAAAAAEVTVEESVDTAIPGSLLKLACASDASVNDACRAVYYYDTDDLERHAFPNEAVYFSWYVDFANIVVVSDAFLASLTLGGNVTYHPGTTMVKFITVNTVYAVGESGELRAIDTEETAASIFGTDWNQQVDDISDAFYNNYEFGADIDSASDYDPDEVYSNVDHIEDIF